MKRLILIVGALAVLFVGARAGADDPPKPGAGKPAGDVTGMIRSLNEEKEALQRRLENVEAELKRLEALEVEQVVSKWKQQAERRARELMRELRLREELRRSNDSRYYVLPL